MLKVGDKVRYNNSNPDWGTAGAVSHPELLEQVGQVTEVNNYDYGKGASIRMNIGGKTHWWALEKDLELVKETPSLPIVYKVVERVGGKLVSTIAGRGKLGLVAQDKAMTTYEEGRITTAPHNLVRGQLVGIFVFETLVEAEKQKKHYAPAAGEIHEATPIGTAVTFERMTTYPAIVLGKRVDVEPPKPKREEWKDITESLTFKLRKQVGDNGYVILIEDNGQHWGELHADGFWKGHDGNYLPPAGYRIDLVKEYGVGKTHSFRIMKRVS